MQAWRNGDIIPALGTKTGDSQGPLSHSLAYLASARPVKNPASQNHKKLTSDPRNDSRGCSVGSTCMCIQVYIPHTHICMHMDRHTCPCAHTHTHICVSTQTHMQSLIYLQRPHSTTPGECLKLYTAETLMCSSSYA